MIFSRGAGRLLRRRVIVAAVVVTATAEVPTTDLRRGIFDGDADTDGNGAVAAFAIEERLRFGGISRGVG